MKNFVKENWFKVGIMAVIIIVAFGIFYFLVMRPQTIVSDNNSEASSTYNIELLRYKSQYIAQAESAYPIALRNTSELSISDFQQFKDGCTSGHADDFDPAYIFECFSGFKTLTELTKGAYIDEYVKYQLDLLNH